MLLSSYVDDDNDDVDDEDLYTMTLTKIQTTMRKQLKCRIRINDINSFFFKILSGWWRDRILICAHASWEIDGLDNDPHQRSQPINQWNLFIMVGGIYAFNKWDENKWKVELLQSVNLGCKDK